MQTVRVKPWGSGQGDHVIINAVDFDPAFHQLADAPRAVDGNPVVTPAGECDTPMTSAAPATRRRRASAQQAAEPTES